MVSHLEDQLVAISLGISAELKWHCLVYQDSNPIRVEIVHLGVLEGSAGRCGQKPRGLECADVQDPQLEPAGALTCVGEEAQSVANDRRSGGAEKRGRSVRVCQPEGSGKALSKTQSGPSWPALCFTESTTHNLPLFLENRHHPRLMALTRHDNSNRGRQWANSFHCWYC